MRRQRLAALAVVVLIALTGCLSLPTDGGVQTGHDGPPADSGLEVVAPGPAPNASEEAIVQGFLLASSFGLGDDFARAREFMTTAGGSQWNALGGVSVYSDAVPLEVVVEEPAADAVATTVTVRATVTATVANNGTYVEAPTGTEQEFHFQLVQITGDQWRISQLEAGVLMSEVTFGTQYREVPVYFLSGDEEPRLVPDLRWLPRSRTVSGSVRALLGGPADWLTSPAVVTAFPGGTQLALEGVEINDRVATVSLSPEFLEASAADRAYAQKQLSETLRQLGQVNRVQISVDGSVLPIDATLAPLAPTPVPVRGPVVLTSEGLGILSGTTVADLGSQNPIPEAFGSLALPYGDGPIVGLSHGNTLVALAEGAAEPVALLGQDGPLLPPTYDAQGWVWTGPTGAGSNEGQLQVADPYTGALESVAVPDLAGTDVVAIRVSREGARLAYAVRTTSAVTVYVAAIQRDAAGRPIAVSQGQPTGAQLTDLLDLVWVDDVELGVLGTDADDDPVVLLVGVGGQSAPLPTVEGQAALAAGDGPRELYLVTEGGDLYGRSGNGWRRVAEETASPAFPG